MNYLSESEENRRQFDRANVLFCASVLHGGKRSKRTFQRWVSVAAAIALLVIGGAAYLLFKSPQVPVDVNTIAEVVVEAPVGSQSRVELPDGSIVWLQSGSKLAYDAAYDRMVSLEGEAYFDVKKNPQKPFMVHAADINVKVTGTVFNLRAYPDEQCVETTLACGAVSLEQKDGSPIFQLRPGQKVSCSRDGKSPEAELIDAWSVLLEKYGVVTIPDASLTEICAVLEHVYGVEISVIGDNGMPVTFSFAKGSKVSDVVSRLENISGKKFNIHK